MKVLIIICKLKLVVNNIMKQFTIRRVTLKAISASSKVMSLNGFSRLAPSCFRRYCSSAKVYNSTIVCIYWDLLCRILIIGIEPCCLIIMHTNLSYLSLIYSQMVGLERFLCISQKTLSDCSISQPIKILCCLHNMRWLIELWQRIRDIKV